MGMVRPTGIVVGDGAHNVAALASLAAASVLCVVAKAHAYGPGDVPIGETAVATGAR